MAPVTPLPCKLYPKIFGGALQSTYPVSMDANLVKDIIVVVGETYDSGLAGIPLNGYRATFAAAFSISSTTIYWAKGDIRKN